MNKDYALGYEQGNRDGYTRGFLEGEKSNNIAFWKEEAQKYKRIIWAIVHSLGEVRLTKLSMAVQDGKSILTYTNPSEDVTVIRAVK